MSLITCRDVALGYNGNIVAEHLTFTVEQGNYLCIVGENGAGKSTLMKALLHLQPPLSGEILMGDGLHQNEIGYLPQQTAAQKDFPASVEEVVRSGCLARSGLRPFYSKEQKQLAAAQMEHLGITGLARRCYRELSGGQQQRVLLARALCATQKVLLLDEPTAGLDPNATRNMYELLQKLNREDGLTILMISHDIGAAVEYASHILHVAREPLFFGTKEEYVKGHGDSMFRLDAEQGGAQK